MQKPAAEPDDNFGFVHTNLFPTSIGLPMTVWVGPNVQNCVDAVVKVSPVQGASTDWRDLAEVSVRAKPELLRGRLSPIDLEAVSRWIRLNETAILDHWKGLTDGADLAMTLRKLDP